MGFTTGLTHVTELNLKATPTDTAYPPSQANVYQGTYPLSRWLYVATLKGYASPNITNAITLKNYLLSDDGQKAVKRAEFLKLFMDEDVNQSGTVNSTDVAAIGSAWGAVPGDGNFNVRADVNRSGTINSTDVGQIGTWWGFDYSSNLPN
jgi:hypothetical protein